MTYVASSMLLEEAHIGQDCADNDTCQAGTRRVALGGVKDRHISYRHECPIWKQWLLTSPAVRIGRADYPIHNAPMSTAADAR